MVRESRVYEEEFTNLSKKDFMDELEQAIDLIASRDESVTSFKVTTESVQEASK